MSGLQNPNCYTCKWRQNLPGDSHSSCQHPKVAGDDVTQIIRILSGNTPNPLGVTPLNLDVVEKGWFFWPMNYDPIWLRSCDGHTPPESTWNEVPK